MSLIRYLQFLIFLIGLTASSLIFGQDQTADDGQTVTFTGDLFARSTPRFLGHGNVVSVVPAGTTAKILETKRMPSGSYAVKVQITKVDGSRGSDTATAGETAWVYDSKSHPWLKFPDTIKAHFYSSQTQTRSNDYPTAPTSTYCPLDSKGTLGHVAESNYRDLQSIGDGTAGSDDAPPVTFKNLVKPEESAKDEDAAVEKYSSSDKVARMIEYAKNNLHSESRPMCYRAVKQDLLLSGTGDSDSVVHGRLEGGYALKAIDDLQDQGMTNLLDNPRYEAMKSNPDLIPKGSVVIYDTGLRGSRYGNLRYGHVEVKGGDGPSHYYSFFDGSTSFMNRNCQATSEAKDLGHPYKIIGVMVNEEN